MPTNTPTELHARLHYLVHAAREAADHDNQPRYEHRHAQIDATLHDLQALRELARA